jgi:hypothetical protein
MPGQYRLAWQRTTAGSDAAQAATLHCCPRGYRNEGPARTLAAGGGCASARFRRSSEHRIAQLCGELFTSANDAIYRLPKTGVRSEHEYLERGAVNASPRFPSPLVGEGGAQRRVRGHAGRPRRLPGERVPKRCGELLQFPSPPVGEGGAQRRVRGQAGRRRRRPDERGPGTLRRPRLSACTFGFFGAPAGTTSCTGPARSRAWESAFG